MTNYSVMLYTLSENMGGGRAIGFSAQMSLCSYLFSYLYYSQRIVVNEISAARQSKALLHYHMTEHDIWLNGSESDERGE